MREAIAVEARFEADGAVRPLAFEWRGRRYLVASLGRQWQQDSDRRFLVMTADEQVYELAFMPMAGSLDASGAGEPGTMWWLQRSPKDFGGRGVA